MVKNMPDWLKKNYNSLWKIYQKKAFTFEDVVFGLKISESMATKTLWQLENKGFVYKTRSELDYRNKIYRLISPEDVSYIIGLYSLIDKEEFKGFTLKDKFILINNKIPYALTGSYAAYQYHHYVNPPKVYEIKIRSEDEGKWIAFLTDGHTRVYLDVIQETKSAKQYIKLIHSPIKIEDIRRKSDSGYYIEKMEYLLIDLIMRETQTSIIEAVAMVINNTADINWFEEKGVIDLALKSNIARELGFLLDAINYESNSNIINEKIISTIKNMVKGNSNTIFPNDDVLLNRYNELRNKIVHRSLISENELIKYRKMQEKFEGYTELDKKWGIQSIMPRNTIRKVLTDLGVS